VVHEDNGLKIQLRSETREGEAVDRGFAHPAAISGVRVTNILSRIDVRMEGKEEPARKPAFSAGLLYELGDRVSAALAEADPSQEVVVQVVRRERRFRIFTENRLTSFVTYVRGDDLYVHLARVDDVVETDYDDSFPEPWPNREVMRFTVLAGEGIIPVAPQAVAAAWRDPVFLSASQVRLGPGGKVMRREILLESPEEEAEPSAREFPGELPPETLRALADLEESRREGAISEAEYQSRRRRILASDPPSR
jgi:hypothetical protein